MAEETIKTKLNDVITDSLELGETAVKLARINTAITATRISSSAALLIFQCIIALLAVLFCSAAAAWWLGYLLHSNATGFLIVGLFYVLLLILSFILKDKIVLPFLRNRIVKKLYE